MNQAQIIQGDRKLKETKVFENALIFLRAGETKKYDDISMQFGEIRLTEEPHLHTLNSRQLASVIRSVSNIKKQEKL